MLSLKPGQLPIFIFNVLTIIVFSAVFIMRMNLEFVFYVAVIVFFLVTILMTNKKVEYNNLVLWGLSIWAFLHMSGGAFYFSGVRLYDIVLIPIVGAPFYIFRYDQFVHIIGFGVATAVMYYLLRPSLGERHWVTISIVVIMAGLGVGGLNEIIEFSASLMMSETGVGDLYNLCLDLVSDLVGAILAMAFLYAVERRE
jgi:uncharacterized membrane protein YjdF